MHSKAPTCLSVRLPVCLPRIPADTALLICCLFACHTDGNTITNAVTGVVIGGGRRNRIHSNTFIDNDLDIEFDNRGMTWMQEYCNFNCTSVHKKSPNQWAGCFLTELESVHYLQPPYATHYPELLSIYQDHPCTPVGNVIENNTYCHAGSLNVSKPAVFINQNESTVRGWLSTMSNNHQVCATATASGD